MQQTCRNVRNRCLETAHLRIPMKADDKWWMGGTGAAIKCALDSTEEARSCQCVRHRAMCHVYGTVPCVMIGALCPVQCALCRVQCAWHRAMCHVQCAVCIAPSHVRHCAVSPAQKYKKWNFQVGIETCHCTSPKIPRTPSV